MKGYVSALSYTEPTRKREISIIYNVKEKS